MASPVEQFTIQDVISLPPVFGYDISLHNSAVAMVGVVLVAVVGLVLATGSRSLVPGRLQGMAEVLYEFVAGMVRDNAGADAKRYFPLVFSLFLFVLMGNLAGMLPYSFTFTSHIIVTAAMAVAIFVFVTILGFAKHGLHYFRMFLPEGVPFYIAPLVIPIEVISYLSRPFSLSVRLAANMTVGHTLLKVLAGFVVAMGVAGVVPFVAVIGITILELGIAILQAYVFAILTCIYLHDALYMH